MNSIFGTRKVNRERRVISGFAGESVSFAPYVQKSISLTSTDFVLKDQTYVKQFTDEISGDVYCHVYVGTSTAGDTLKVETPLGDVITYTNIAQGQWHRMAITKIFKTGTSVSDLIIGR